ncbi:MAG: hypothetical protein MUO54_06545 [Anaerolineales bacterium]|nr:hypothetical protein [Anaerolineales bacterium]
MKRIIFSVTIILFVGALNGQVMQKGSLLGFHVVDEPSLNAGVTIKQFEDFYYNKYIPEFQKLFTELEVIPLRGLRGEHADKAGMIIFMKNEKVRDMYWNEDGSHNETSLALLAKMAPIQEEANSMGTMVDLYTDWLVK